MADEITPTYTIQPLMNPKVLHVLFEDFDGANETGIIDAWTTCKALNFVPKACTIIATNTGTGTDTTVDIDVDVSMDNTTYTTSDINALATFGTYDHHPAYGVAQDEGMVPWRYWKITVVDQGTNNTLQVDMWLSEGF